MKHSMSGKQQGFSAGDKGGTFSPSHVESKKTRLEHRDESFNTNPNSQTLFTQNKMTSEERESDVQVKAHSHSFVFDICQIIPPFFTTYHLCQCTYSVSQFDKQSQPHKPPGKVGSRKSVRQYIFKQGQIKSEFSKTTEQEQKQFLFQKKEKEKEIVGETVIGLSNPTEPASPVPFSTHITLPQRLIPSLTCPPVQSGNEPGADNKHPGEMEPPMIEHFSATVLHMLPAHSHLSSTDSCGTGKMSSHLPCSHSLPSLSNIHFAKDKFTRAKSLPDMLLKDGFEVFSPDVTVGGNEETYSFHCSRPGLYQCSVTDLVFHMEGEGDMAYRIVPWNRRLLSQHHKKPAGPLFDIECLQQSVCQLYLPHCEVRSTGGCEFLSVAHVKDDGVEFIAPHKITETHVIINITGFSSLGNVKGEDSPPDPVRALVLLFYRPPTDSDPESLLNVLLLPKNVVLRDVQRMRKKLVGDERYIETSPHCRLQPKQEYKLSTSPEGDSVLIQPTEAEFDEECYDNYFPSFQVTLENSMTHIKLFLIDSNSSPVWERRVCLLSTGVRESCGASALTLPSNKRLKNVRTCFIDGISGPVLSSLLDKLLGRSVVTDSEMMSAHEMQNKNDKARFVIDTVRNKGEAASSEMIKIFCEDDPFLCEHLGLI